MGEMGGGLGSYAIRFTQVRLDGRGRVLIPAKMRRPPASWRKGDVIDVELLDAITIKLTNRSLKYRIEEVKKSRGR